MSELAALVITTLDAQKQYFKSRSREDLIASKQLETKLRKAAESEIKQSPLFGDEPVVHDGSRPFSEACIKANWHGGVD